MNCQICHHYCITILSKECETCQAFQHYKSARCLLCNEVIIKDIIHARNNLAKKIEAKFCKECFDYNQKYFKNWVRI